MKRIFIIAISFLTLIGTPVYAVDNKNKGLEVSPSRHILTAKAGDTKTVTTTITNNSNVQKTISLSIEQFSVNDSTDAMIFKPSYYDWISTKEPSVALSPGESTSTNYTVSVPRDAAASEYYFALIASNQTNQKTVRVASLVYLYVEGGKVRQQSTLSEAHTPLFVFGSTIPYSFTAKNTGNIHSEFRSNAYLQGISWYSSSPDSYSIVLPGHSKDIEGSVTSPFFPGIYKLTYGYSDERAEKTTSNTATIVYVPPWSIAALTVIGLCFLWGLQKRRR